MRLSSPDKLMEQYVGVNGAVKRGRVGLHDRPPHLALIRKHPQQISISDEKPGLWRPLVPPLAHLSGHRFNLEQAIEAIPTSPCHSERSEESRGFDLEQAIEAIPTIESETVQPQIGTPQN